MATKTIFPHSIIEFNGSKFMIREIPAGYYPKALHPHKGLANNVCCMNPVGSTDLIPIPADHYKLIGPINEITELDGLPWSPPADCPKQNAVILKIEKPITRP